MPWSDIDLVIEDIDGSRNPADMLYDIHAKLLVRNIIYNIGRIMGGQHTSYQGSVNASVETGMQGEP